MIPESTTDTQLRAAEEAAFWLLTLQSEDFGPVQRGEFGDWLRRSPLNVAEMLRICQVHRHLVGFSDWASLAPAAEPVLPANVVPLPVARTVEAQPATAAPRARLRRRVAGLAIAAAMAAAMFGALLLVFAPDRHVYATQDGERRAVTLADGSVVGLAPSSRVVVEYRAKERLITLDRGEALFRVAKNPNRPFLVRAVDTRVRAVGTVFQVGRDEEGVVVTVVEGRIAVTSLLNERAHRGNGVSAPGELELTANQQVAVNAQGVMEPVHTVQSGSEVAWTTDQFRFENQTVAEVARRFNQYNQVKIEVLDPALASRRISGVLRVSDPESFVAFITAAAGTRVTRSDPNRLVLEAAASGSASKR